MVRIKGFTRFCNATSKVCGLWNQRKTSFFLARLVYLELTNKTKIINKIMSDFWFEICRTKMFQKCFMFRWKIYEGTVFLNL